MFLLRPPDEKTVRLLIAEQRPQPFSYAEVGASRSGVAPAGYNADHNRIRLGTGRTTFSAAVAAIKSWKMFDLDWIKLFWTDAPVIVGTTVGVAARHFGFWSLNVSRIVYVLDERDGDVEKYGFAYGTLPAHVERGEERFSVEYHHSDESVWYDLFAFSQPRHLFARMGYPVSRYLQKTFAADSKQAMLRAVKSTQAT